MTSLLWQIFVTLARLAWYISVAVFAVYFLWQGQYINALLAFILMELMDAVSILKDINNNTKKE